MDELTRRGVLAGTATLGTVGLAGCATDDSENDNDTDGNGNNTTDGNESGNTTDDNGSNATDTDQGSRSGSLSLVGTTVETTDTGCGAESDGTVAARVDDGMLVLDGTLVAGTPCHDAVVERAELSDGSLSIMVDAAPTDVAACDQCLGAIEYVVSAEFSSDLTAVSDLAGVTVGHAGGDTYSLTEGELVAQAGSNDLAPGIASRSLTTVEATCGGQQERTVTRDGRTVTVDGMLPTADPCHEATLGRLSVTGGTLSVEVGARSTAGPNEVCATCLGSVSYQATVTLESGVSVDTVDVRHNTSVSPRGEAPSKKDRPSR